MDTNIATIIMKAIITDNVSIIKFAEESIHFGIIKQSNKIKIIDNKKRSIIDQFNRHTKNNVIGKTIYLIITIIF